MDTIRTLVIDETPRRDHLLTYLNRHQDIQVVGSAGGNDGGSAIRACNPDLVIVGAELTGTNGFDVVRSSQSERRPLLIFISASEHHALRAFQVGALDYILEPLDPERLNEGLQRARARLRDDPTRDLGRRLLAILRSARTDEPTVDRLIVRSGRRVLFVRTDDIDWIQAAGNYLRIHVGPVTHLLRETMSGIEAKLDPEKFLRIHRSRIVNVDRIRELQPWLNGECAVLLTTGTRLTLSRGVREKLQSRLAGMR